ncbi:hypothetical protein [Kistimonas scapharcae]|uniref:hypothetical protein n=1 Tax=Kistimonas scapharcae TaxID=1036133 RepID=UPI0031ED78B0
MESPCMEESSYYSPASLPAYERFPSVMIRTVGVILSRTTGKTVIRLEVATSRHQITVFSWNTLR